MAYTLTGIKGFDELLRGGIPRGKIILLSGTPGTGKTIFALQYLYNGAKKYNEKGLYVSFEEKSSNLRNQAKHFGWDIPAMEKQGILRILDISPRQIKETIAKDILEIVHKGKYQRLVIDSLSALAINSPTTHIAPTELTEISIKRFMYGFIHDLRCVDVTTLLISQTREGILSTEGVSEFISDGIIHIKYEPMGGDYSRYLSVRKMREVANDEDIHPLEISKKGIVIHTL